MKHDATPSKLVSIAQAVAKQLIGMNDNDKERVLLKLKKQNDVLHALVITALKTTGNSAKRGAAMGKEGSAKPGVKLVHFEFGSRLFTLEAIGVEYKQEMAYGDLLLEKIVGKKEAVQRFIKAFHINNTTCHLYLASDDGSKVVFQPPIAIATINSSSEDKSGKITLNRVKMKFHRELVTLRLDGKCIGEDENE